MIPTIVKDGIKFTINYFQEIISFFSRFVISFDIFVFAMLQSRKAD
jgi:hypothetical protein